MATLVDVLQLRGQKRPASVYQEGSILSILLLSEDILDNPAWAEPLPVTAWGQVPIWPSCNIKKVVFVLSCFYPGLLNILEVILAADHAENVVKNLFLV